MSGLDFEGADPQDEAVRISGRVKWFDPGKGYGFIVPDDPGQTGLKDVLLHVTRLRHFGHENALEGSMIVCDAVRRPDAGRSVRNCLRGSPSMLASLGVPKAEPPVVPLSRPTTLSISVIW